MKKALLYSVANKIEKMWICIVLDYIAYGIGFTIFDIAVGRVERGRQSEYI